MNKLLCIVTIMLISASAHSCPEIVFCKKIGDLSGAVSTFERRCPVGWSKVR